MKSCPFCGVEDKKDDLLIESLCELYEMDIDRGDSSDLVVRCQCCGACGPPCSTTEKAVKSWDKRDGE